MPVRRPPSSSIVPPSSAGSPGPFPTRRPGHAAAFPLRVGTSWSYGRRRTETPRSSSARRMLVLIPQSRTATSGPARAGEQGRVLRGDLGHEALLGVGGGGPRWRARSSSSARAGRPSARPSMTPRTTPSERRMLGEPAGVDARDPRDALFLEPVLERTTARPVVRSGSCRARRRPGPGSSSLSRSGSPSAVARRRAGDAVVPEERVGERQDLAAERGVGERLRISHHPGREDDLARRGGCWRRTPRRRNGSRPREIASPGGEPSEAIRHGRWTTRKRPRRRFGFNIYRCAASGASRGVAPARAARHQIPRPVLAGMPGFPRLARATISWSSVGATPGSRQRPQRSSPSALGRIARPGSEVLALVLRPAHGEHPRVSRRSLRAPPPGPADRRGARATKIESATSRRPR